ncbi:GTP 3',8-cyclase MoaA [Spirochaetota bacterium]
MLTDNFLRKHNYLRVSITDKCNLRCKYCMPPEGVVLLTHNEILRNEEFVELIKVFVEMGIDKIRFTGGEPLLRKNFMDIISNTRKLFPHVKLALTSNGILLGKYLEDLRSLKVNKINISLDTLSRGRYETLTGRDSFNEVLENIDSALDMDCFNIKINTVLFEETLDEIDDFLEYIKDRDLILRFIEKMPFTDETDSLKFIPAKKLIETFETRGKLKRNESIDTNVALMYRFIYKEKYNLKIGIIPPMTHKFCSSCNRLRLTSDGHLKTCLHSSDEHDLKTPMRNGIGLDKLKEIIRDAIDSKHEGHNLDCYSHDGGCVKLNGTRVMSKIGG